MLLGRIALAEDVGQISPPATVSMHLENVETHKALAELTKQTGIEFPLWPEQLFEKNKELPKKISVNLDDETFWPALDQILVAGHLATCDSPYGLPGSSGSLRGIMLQGSNGWGILGKGPRSVGPLATVVGDRIEHKDVMPLSADGVIEPQSSASMQMWVYVDPRIRMMKYQDRVVVERAEDEAGHSIAAAQSGRDIFRDTNTNWHTGPMTIPLDYSPQKSHQLALLKGTIKIIAAPEVDRVEFDNLANAAGTEKEAGGLKIGVDDVKEGEQIAEVKIHILRTTRTKEDFSAIGNNIFQDGRFVAEDGKEARLFGTGASDDHIWRGVLRSKYSNNADKPAKLVWEIPKRIEQIDLPFEFRELALP